MSELKLLVVDDSLLYRKVLQDIIAETPGMVSIGSASNGADAVQKIRDLKPDVVTLDVEMPVMNGLETLQKIKEERLKTKVIMVSSLTLKGAEATIQALELGAFEMVTKPDGAAGTAAYDYFRQQLVPILKSISVAPAPPVSRPVSRPPITPRTPATSSPTAPRRPTSTMGSLIKAKVVGIGISTGGPNALTKLFADFKAPINVPILIVQHMPRLFTKSLAESLDALTAIKVKEAEDGELVRNNVAYIAPGGQQMKVDENEQGICIRITDDPPERFCKPSVDYLFRSMAKIYGNKVLGVIMTGMGNDGTLGLKLLKRNGIKTIGQDQASCTVYGMPREAMAAGVVDMELPLEEIAQEIKKSV